MESKILPVGELIQYSVGGGWGKEDPQGDFQIKVAVIRGADFPSIYSGKYDMLPTRWEKKAKAAKAALQPGDIVLEISGGTDERPTGRTLYITKELLETYSIPVIPASFCRIIRPKQEIDSAYLFFWLQSMYIKGRTWGYQNRSTGLSNFQYKVFVELEQVIVPKLDKQRKISELLMSFEEMRRLNNRVNDCLAQLATAMFEGALEAECHEELFGDIVELEDSKRIPLNSRDREQRKGPYPYYGATSIMDYVDDYLFDGVRILLGEDGSVITDEGGPVLQYVWGKYWVNNHAHILIPRAKYSLEMLYVALSRTSIAHIVTGAVQKKISQKNLKTLVLEMPNQEQVQGLDVLFNLYRSNIDQNKQLEQLRDTLLPKLMASQIDVSQVEFPTSSNNHLCDDC